MTLKQIPVEPEAPKGTPGDHPGSPPKTFHPKMEQTEKGKETGFFKNICLRLIHFINKGSKYTYQQIDELILTLQKLVLNLQKKKHEILKQKSKKLNKKTIKFEKKRIV